MSVDETIGLLPFAVIDRNRCPCFTVQTAAPVACATGASQTPYPTQTPVAPPEPRFQTSGKTSDLHDEWLWDPRHRAATSHPPREWEGDAEGVIQKRRTPILGLDVRRRATSRGHPMPPRKRK